MDIGVEQITGGLKDEPVTRDRAQPAEALGHNAHAVVAATVARAGMADMLVTVVDDLKQHRRQCRLQTRTQTFAAVIHGNLQLHMNGGTNGKTVANGTESVWSGTLPRLRHRPPTRRHPTGRFGRWGH